MPDPEKPKSSFLQLTLPEIRRVEPDLWQMLKAMLDTWPLAHSSLSKNISALNEEDLKDRGISRNIILSAINDFTTHIANSSADKPLERITIIGGQAKDGTPEKVRIEIARGDTVCLVGATGAGKSQLLSDLECLAQRDTPSKRQILLDGKEPDTELRFSIEQKIVAQLTQNMNFVMDIPAGDFILQHAKSRLKPEPEKLTRRVLQTANSLAGENFAPETALTGLSGGQSRALMIADTALICDSPVVLIDEIENAGVDRRKALELLLAQDKIIMLATHDPVLALLADQRITIRDGAIASIMRTSQEEKELLQSLLIADERTTQIRSRLRNGERISPATTNKDRRQKEN